jgi:hypothetical protein
MAEIVHMHHPMHPGPVEIDDSRLQSMWARQHRRHLLGAGALSLIGVAAILVGVAMVIWALRLNTEPPVVNVAPPVVNIAPPAVNVTVPPLAVAPPLPQAAPAMALQAGESKVVTEYTLFHEVTVGDYTVTSGWRFRDSKDAVPYAQWCYVAVGRTGRLALANNGQISPTIGDDAPILGIDVGQAMAFVKSCRWHQKGA